MEAIFNYPGLGGLLFSSVLSKDIFVINGVVTVLILSLAFTVFLIDLIYPLIDPRIRHSAMTAQTDDLRDRGTPRAPPAARAC